MRNGKRVIKRPAGFVRGWVMTKSTPQRMVLLHTDKLEKAIIFDNEGDARRFLGQDHKVIKKYQPEVTFANV
jgi:hypothetical protein